MTTPMTPRRATTRTCGSTHCGWPLPPGSSLKSCPRSTDSVDWTARGNVYADALTTADEDIQATLEVVPPANRKLVTNHDALGYFASRYGFEVVGVVIPGGSTLAEPSSAELTELVAVVEQEQVQAIFAETTNPEVLADAVAAEAGGEVIVVELFTGSLGEPGSGADHPHRDADNQRPADRTGPLMTTERRNRGYNPSYVV